MSHPTVNKKNTIQEKALHKSPYSLNNHTFFSYQCFYQNTIINGISLSVHQGRGLSNNPVHLDYLDHSQKFVYQAGCNIIAYNTYRRNYQVICQTGELNVLRATSLSNPQKEYIIWGQKIIQSNFDGQKIISKICLYGMHQKQLIYCEKFLTLERFDDIIAFMHPVNILAAVQYNEATQNSTVIFKILNEKESDEFQDQNQIVFPYDLRKMVYDVDSNSYLFKKSKTLYKLIVQAKKSPFQESEKLQNLLSPQNFTLKVQPALSLPNQIIHFCSNESSIVLLTGDQDNRFLQFYSSFNLQLLLKQKIQSKNNKQIQQFSEKNMEKDLPLINFFEFKKSVIIGVYGDSSCICIYSVYEQSLRYVRDTELGLQNCFNIQRIFINPYNSQVLVASKHYELQGNFTNICSKKKINIETDLKFKNVFLQVSTFFITMQSSMINVKNLGLSQRKYCQIITIPWSSETYFQTQNSILCSRWQEKFDGIIKCSAIHPMGQFLALGFSDCFKIYYLAYEGLQHSFINENVKECSSLCFSQRGNDFAVATSCSIIIYQCYSFTKKHQISLGLSHKINRIYYQTDYLFCFSNGNRIWIYDVHQNYKQYFTFNPRNHLENTNPLDNFIYQLMKKNSQTQTTASQNKVNSIFYDYVTRVVIFSAASKIYFINSKNYECIGCFQFQNISCMQYSRPLKTLFLGTQQGKLIAFPWPNKPLNISSKLPTFYCHNKKIQGIKVSSDLFHVISITQSCLYKHQITKIVQMRKLSKYELQRQCAPEAILSLDFVARKGLCIFTNDAYQRKYQYIKENEQQALNLNFILPEQREKQKNKMMNKLMISKQDCQQDLHDSFQPIRVTAMNIKQKNRFLNENLLGLKKGSFEQKQRQNEQYNKKMSELSQEKQNLQDQLVKMRKMCNNAIKKQQSLLKNQAKVKQIQYYVKINQLQEKVKTAENDRNLTLRNFYEIQQIDQQKQIFQKDVIHKIDQEITNFNHRIGYLMCRNTNLEKQITTKRRKIQDIQDMIMSVKRSISALPHHKNKNSSQKTNQNITHQYFFQTQQRYQKQTKKLIQKNKAVNVCIQMYSKERDVLIALEKQIQKYEEQIETTIQYLNHEKNDNKGLQQRLDQLIDKVKVVMQVHKKRSSQKIRLISQFKTFKYNVALYIDGILNLNELKKLSNIAPQNMVKAPVKLQKQNQFRKRKIEKITAQQNKTISLMNSHRKIFSNEKKKIYMQNQDLLVTFNTLTHKNKYLANIINSQQNPTKKMNITLKSKMKMQPLNSINRPLKPTPFQQYIKSKTTRRVKTSPCAQYNI